MPFRKHSNESSFNLVDLVNRTFCGKRALPVARRSTGVGETCKGLRRPCWEKRFGSVTAHSRRQFTREVSWVNQFSQEVLIITDDDIRWVLGADLPPRDIVKMIPGRHSKEKPPGSLEHLCSDKRHWAWGLRSNKLRVLFLIPYRRVCEWTELSLTELGCSDVYLISWTNYLHSSPTELHE